MRKNHLLLSGRNIRRLARKDDQGHGGGNFGMGGTNSFTPPNPTPTPPANNGGGNSEAAGGDSQRDNNGGQKFDPSAFWNSPSEGSDSTPRPGESAGGPNPSGGQQPQQEMTPVQRVVEEMGKLSFGESPMSEKAIAELNEGKMDSFNQGMEAYGRQIVGQTVRLMAGLMGQLREEIRAENQQALGGTLSQRDNDAQLLADIPSAKNPSVKKMIEPIFARAMEVSKGDRKAATAMTKEMMKFMTQETEGDLGLAPRSAGDGESLQKSNVNWLEELSGR